MQVKIRLLEIVIITDAAVWAELFPQLCTNCSESIKLYNLEEKLSLTLAPRPWNPLTWVRPDAFICFMPPRETHQELEKDSETGRQTEGDKGQGYIFSDLF